MMGTKKIEDLLAKATPGPWSVGETQQREIGIVADCFVIAVKRGALYHPKGDANAALIALTPTIAQALLDSRAQIDALREALDKTHKLISAFAVSGFTDHKIGEQLFLNQGQVSRALAAHPPTKPNHETEVM